MTPIEQLTLMVVVLFFAAFGLLVHSMVLQQHIVQLEIRTAVLCPHGLPAPAPVPIGPDGCTK